MAWVKVEKPKGYDLKVNEKGISISFSSRMWKMLRENKYRVDIYIDEEEGRIAFIPNSSGIYSWKNSRKDKSDIPNLYPQIFKILGVGNYYGEDVEIDGMKGLMFRRSKE